MPGLRGGQHAGPCRTQVVTACTVVFGYWKDVQDNGLDFMSPVGRALGDQPGQVACARNLALTRPRQRTHRLRRNRCPGILLSCVAPSMVRRARRDEQPAMPVSRPGSSTRSRRAAKPSRASVDLTAEHSASALLLDSAGPGKPLVTCRSRERGSPAWWAERPKMRDEPEASLAAQSYSDCPSAVT